MAKHSGLGKGLDSLISKKYSEKSAQTEKKAAERETGKETLVKIELITPNREQPRKTFDAEALAELTESIKQHGVIQPLIVVKKGKGYEIIAGERRYRAAKQAGLKELPVIVREYTEKEKSEIALIENIQREDLNPIEEARAYEKLINDHGLRQEDLAERISKSRSAITNRLRLLKLPEKVRQMVIEGSLSEGHARALLGATGAKRQEQLAAIVVARGLSVRETEALIKRGAAKKKVSSVKTPDDELYARLEDDLKQIMSTKVTIKRESDERGRIVIEYYSLDELDRLTELFKKGRED